jgi:hypothetical protein
MLEKPSVTQDQNVYVTENSVIHSGPIYVDDGIFRHIPVDVFFLRHPWFFF